MTPQQLKNSILQRAIEGRLVEQRPEEGTAKELLKEIQAEKVRLVKEGKIKKSKALPPITEEEKPFDIPEGWEWVRLGDIIQISSGDGLTSKNMIDDGIPVYGGNGITGYHNKSNVDKETVVIGRVGFYCGSVHVTPTKAWVTDNAFITIYPENYVDRSYLVFILRHMNLGKDNNATAQHVVSGKKIYPMLFPLPPLDEQRRIVAKIEELLPLIDKYDEAYTKLTDFNTRFPEAMKKSLLQYAIQGKLVEQRANEGTAQDLLKDIQAEKKQLIAEKKIKNPKALPPITEDEIPFDIPDNWEWVRLDSIVYNHGQEKPNAPFTYIDIGSVDNSKQRLGNEDNIVLPENAPSRARKIVETGDIIYATVRPYLHNMCIIDREFPEKPIASTGFAVMTPHTGVNNKYLFYYLLSPTFDIYANSNENSKGVAYPAINDKALYSAIIALPPLAEQHRIVAKLEELLPFCDQLRSKQN